MLTQEVLKDHLNYDPETGIFIWIKKFGNKCNRIKLGTEAGYYNGNGYRCITINKKDYGSHRLAWLYVYGNLPEHDIDHINGIPDDNRIANLRDVTKHRNMQNMNKPTRRNTCGLLGVSFDKDRKKYQAQICTNGKYKHIGRYDTKEEAHEAYLTAKRQLHTTCTI